MATRPVRFTAIPNIPQVGLSDWQFQTFNAMKENVELLIGARGDRGGSNQAIIRGQITVNNVPNPTIQQVTAQGIGSTISGQNLASLEDFGRLINNVQQLITDVTTLRNTVNTLINQLKG
jgi:hypothetical protein